MTSPASPSALSSDAHKAELLRLGLLHVWAALRLPLIGSILITGLGLAPLELLPAPPRTLLFFLSLVLACGQQIVAAGALADAGFAPVERDRKLRILEDPLRGTFGTLAIGLSLITCYALGSSSAPSVAFALGPLLGALWGLCASFTLDPIHSRGPRALGGVSLLLLSAAVFFGARGSLPAAVGGSLAALLAARWAGTFTPPGDLRAVRTAGLCATLTYLAFLSR